MDEEPMVEDSDSSSSSSVDGIVNTIKLCYPKAIVNVEVLESYPRHVYKGKNKSHATCTQLNLNNCDGRISYSSDSLHGETSFRPFIPPLEHEGEEQVEYDEAPGCSYLTNRSSVNSSNLFMSETCNSEADNVSDDSLVNNSPLEVQSNKNIDNPGLMMDTLPVNDLEEENLIEGNDVDDPDWVPPISPQDIIDLQEEGENPDNITIGNVEKQRKRKIHSEQSSWNDAKNKQLRQSGKGYVGWEKPKNGKGKRGPDRESRKLGPPCASNACRKSKLRQCQSVEEEERKELFSFFWEKLSWDQKKLYIISLVTKSEKKQTRKKPQEESRRNFSYSYKVKKPNGDIVPVCKAMFLNTFGLKEWSVLNWVASAEPHGMTTSQNTKCTERRANRQTGNEAKEKLCKFLDSLPKLPSHYCRKSTSRIYLEPTGGNMTDVYNEYKRNCAINASGPIKPLSRFTFDKVIQDKNIAFQPPKKDRCDTCISYESGQVEEVDYNDHIARKEAARAEKAKDKEMGAEGKCIVLTQDLQSVKICPSLNASALYYKTKLICHNFTIFDINNHTARCCWFDETDADLTANTFASCIIDYLTEVVVDNRPIILWSDGCTPQNRNSIFSNALLCFSHVKNVTITQKFLEKGHTQMEVDSVHATIERKIKNKPIHLPSDYIRYTQTARQNPTKPGYETKAITHDMIRDFSAKDTMVYESIRPGKKPGDPTVTDIKAIQYLPSGVIMYKLSFDADFVVLPQRRKLEVPNSLSSFKKLHKNKLKISRTKWQHLQDLKFVLPTDCHSFYDNLKYDQDTPSANESTTGKQSTLTKNIAKKRKC